MLTADAASQATPAEPPLPVPEHTAQDAADAIDRILAGPGFGDDRSWLQRAYDWVLDQLGRLLGEILDAGGGSALGWLAVAALGLAAVLLAVRLTRGVRRDPGLAASSVISAPVRPAADWRADAEAHEAAGRWREAVRCHWRHLVAALAETGVIDDVPGRTAGEYRSAVASALPGGLDPFARATDVFEHVWYGDAEAGPHEAAAVRDAAAQALGPGRRPLVGASR